MFAVTPRHSEMPPCERSSRARLQISLESDRRFFRWEFDRDDKRPRSITHGVTTRAVVVPIQTIGDVVGDPGVVTRGVSVASYDVDDALLDSVHAELVAFCAPARLWIIPLIMRADAVRRSETER